MSLKDKYSFSIFIQNQCFIFNLECKTNYKCNVLSRQEQESQWANDSENCGSPSQSKKIKKEGGGEQKKPKKKKTSEGGKLKRSEEEEDDDARPLTSASPFVR